MRETFPFEAPHKYMIFDRDHKFGPEVAAMVKATGILPKRTPSEVLGGTESPNDRWKAVDAICSTM